ncbi:glycine--tRNA ligase [bacterium]|nr:glycine--tRNA ligase [bacterium]
MTTENELKPHVTLDTIVSLCKRRGIIFPGSEIYEGLQGTYDYGPIGAELKKNVKNLWWKSMIYDRDDVEGIDCAILMNPKVWKASGHVDTFSDPLADSMGPSRKRYRADHVEPIECTAFEVIDVTDEGSEKRIEGAKIWAPSKKKAKEFYQTWWEKHLGLAGRRVKLEEVAGSTRVGRFSPDDGGELGEPRAFNLMLSTHCGPVADSAAKVYLRPETAQGMFVNYSNVQTSMRRKLPFGIAQMGRSFRNEITPKNFIFRTREFEQMEMEFFCKPGHLCKEGELTDDQWHEHWVEYRTNFYVKYGIRRDHLRFHYQTKEELAHYSKACCDIEFLFPLGWQELEGIANRTDYDLRMHMEHSGKDLKYFDQELNTHYVPYVIEPAAGVDRAVLAFLTDAYLEEQVKEDKRVVLKLHPELAPIKAAVFPLLKNRPELVEMARNLCREMKQSFYTVYDDTAAIGKLYRRQDEIGTPFCVTVDVDSLDDQAVTVRDRDSMQQVRIGIDKVRDYIAGELRGKS